MIKRILFAALLLIPTWVAFPLTAKAQTEPSALLRIDPRSEQERADLAELGLLSSDWLTAANGELFVIAAAGPVVQQALRQGGFRFSVLDPEVQEAGYTLLYGSQKALTAASKRIRILLREDPLALAPTSPDQHPALIKLGLDLSPLVLSPLRVPKFEPQMEAVKIQNTLTPIYLVQEMLAQVSSIELYNLVGGLSGEWAVNIAGSPYTLATRYSYTNTPITKATRYTNDLLGSYGLATWYDYYSLYGAEKRSVIAQQTGLTQPEKILLLTAHLDSTSYMNGNSYILAPGADDNASGSAALLHIADILSQYDFGCTLRYALFTGEEQGMIGSKAYAQDVYYQGEDLQAVLNLDMLAYNTPASSATLELHTRNANTGDLAIANIFRNAVSGYGLQLSPLILQDGKTFSDHSSFWNYGYPAILAIEDWNDHTPYYHMTSDRLGSLNMGYYTEFTRASLAAFAHLGCLYDSRLMGTVRDDDDSQPIPGAHIEAWQGGVIFHSTTSHPDGSFSLDLPTGSYTIKVSAQDHLSASFPDTVVVSTQPVSLNPRLTPCVFVSSAAASALPHIVSIAETVNFSASAAGEAPLEFTWDFGDGQTASGQAISHAFATQGAYPVELTVSNLCGVPQSVLIPVFVDVERFFLPAISQTDSH